VFVLVPLRHEVLFRSLVQIYRSARNGAVTSRGAVQQIGSKSKRISELWS
jgi:hypothetical protein